MKNMKNVTEELLNHRFVLISPQKEKFVSVNGFGDFNVAGPSLDVIPPFLLRSYTLQAATDERSCKTCVIYDVDEGKPRFLYVDESGLVCTSTEKVGDKFSFFMIDNSHCYIYSYRAKSFLSMDYQHNLDEDGFACAVYANKEVVDESCVFGINIVA